jgi:hypothetical protein
VAPQSAIGGEEGISIDEVEIGTDVLTEVVINLHNF